MSPEADEVAAMSGAARALSPPQQLKMSCVSEDRL
jgi:hypothetical protein